MVGPTENLEEYIFVARIKLHKYTNFEDSIYDTTYEKVRSYIFTK